MSTTTCTSQRSATRFSRSPLIFPEVVVSVADNAERSDPVQVQPIAFEVPAIRAETSVLKRPFPRKRGNPALALVFNRRKNA